MRSSVPSSQVASDSFGVRCILYGSAAASGGNLAPREGMGGIPEAAAVRSGIRHDCGECPPHTCVERQIVDTLKWARRTDRATLRQVLQTVAAEKEKPKMNPMQN